MPNYGVCPICGGEVMLRRSVLGKYIITKHDVVMKDAKGRPIWQNWSPQTKACEGEGKLPKYYVSDK